ARFDRRSELLEFFRQLSSIKTLAAFEERPRSQGGNTFLTSGIVGGSGVDDYQNRDHRKLRHWRCNQANSTRQYLIVKIREMVIPRWSRRRAKGGNHQSAPTATASMLSDGTPSLGT